ncbi:MAG TPA: hypothetical protein VK890_13845 [Bacteroidia bacterium]|jgi:hypothetical protein|nr:hypothetical protein [Bacteroidia bacterium]
MKLLTSQKDAIYDLIEASLFFPAKFEFSEISSKNFHGTIATILSYKNTEYSFSFENLIGSNDHYAIFCPGASSHTDNDTTLSWTNQLNAVNRWLSYLEREVTSPNKFKRLKHEIEGIKMVFTNDEDKFSVHEFEDVQRRVALIKESTLSLGLLPQQINSINSKLDHLTEMAKELNKFDWKSLFIGAIVTIIIQLEVTPEHAKLLWDLIKRSFDNYLLP